MRVFFAVILTSFFSYSSISRDKEKLSKKFQDSLDIIIENVEKVLDPDWFIQKNDTGFSVIFCRTCEQKYQQYISFTRNAYQDSLDSVLEFYPERNDFLSFYGPDSVWLRNTVSLIRSSPNDSLAKYRNLFKSTLTLNVWFEPKWTPEKIIEISAINDSVKNCILSTRSKINYHSFTDYRYLILDYYQDCYYQGTQPMRYLPYTSNIWNYSVFIVRDPKTIFKRVHFDPANDLSQMYTTENLLDPLIARTLRIIALALGVQDYKTLEDYIQPNNSGKRKFNNTSRRPLQSDIELR